MTTEATPREVGSHAGLGPLPEPVAWFRAPYGTLEPNPLFRVTGPQSLEWAVACYTEDQLRAAVAAERERCAAKTGEYAQTWWSKHCASNKHMETTRAAHEDFCRLQADIRRA